MKSLEASCERGFATLLMDEPDRSLDIPAQAEIWRTLSRPGKLQLIIATHSPFALHLPDAAYIDLKKGYLEECRATVAKAFKR